MVFQHDQRDRLVGELLQEPHLACGDSRRIVDPHRPGLAAEDRDIMLVGAAGQTCHDGEVASLGLAQFHDRVSILISVFTELAMKQSSCA